MNRRNFIKGTVAAAGITAVAPYVAAPAQAGLFDKKSKRGGQAAGYYRTKVGGLTVTSLLDGNIVFSDSLMQHISQKDLKAAREANFINAEKDFPKYVNAFVVESAAKTTLIDTGARGFADTLGHVSENLDAAGYAAKDIDEVILTHAHPDHINGLLDADGKAVFQNAKVRIHQDEWAFWMDDTKMAAMADKKALFEIVRNVLAPYKARDQIETYASNADLGGGLSSVHLPGHTPGHSGVRVSDGADQLLIWGDIVHIPALQIPSPDISIAFDIDPAQAVQTRKKIFEEVAADRIRLAGMHLCFPGIGHLAKRKGTKGYDFVPQIWEAF